MKCIISTIVLIFFVDILGAQTIINGSFENWTDSCAIDQAPVGWNNMSINGGPDQRGPGCDGAIPAYDSTNFMCLRWLNGPGNIADGASTTISGLIPTQTYVISYFVRPDDFWIYTNDIGLNYFIGGINVGTTALISETGTWQEQVFYFVPMTSTIEFGIQVADPSGNCIAAALDIDKISIQNITSLSELDAGSKSLVKIVDCMGRETSKQPNTVQFYIYSDGTTIKKVFVE